MLVTQEQFQEDVSMDVLINDQIAWTNHDLSRDHKPSDKDESERIIKRKGRIEPFRGLI